MNAAILRILELEWACQLVYFKVTVALEKSEKNAIISHFTFHGVKFQSLRSLSLSCVERMSLNVMSEDPSGLTLPSILCCICGIKIQSNPSNMCVNCLKTQVDITEGISKQITIFFCKNCERYQRPPWVRIELESREMLALCLKKIKGLNREVKVHMFE